MKILLLGGTGAIGKYLTELLVDKGHDLYVTSRKEHSSKEIHYIKGNAHDIEFIKGVFDSNGSFDCIVDFMSYQTKEFSVRSKLLINSCRQYVFISTARVYSNGKGKITEETPRLLDVSTDRTFIRTDDYSITKAKQENFIKRHSPQNWTIIRPYITYGDNRFELCVHSKEDWLYRAISGRSIVFPNDIGEHLTTMTWGGDVAFTIESLLGREECLGQIYNITNKKSYTWNEVLNVYCDTLQKNGFQPQVVRVKKDVLTHSHNGRYQIMYDRLYDRSFNTQKIEKYVDVNTFRDIKDQLAECLTSFLKEPKFNSINWMLQGYYDRVSKVGDSQLERCNGFTNKIKYLIGRYTPGYIIIEEMKSMLFPLFLKTR